ncbi:PREDICTED: cell division cycle 20.5, cofactor of APC complex-like [Ipomoea nil]|uniref:cell division cycle 20.5, cofactor of APC complex-like n=1 Tax=Ipomoea nil TaxID=35883 RepID=UPI000901A60B|nr:PREDICTED: cell division cycle 20.5, cofactor of APC complex-like [Ipomoea nil]
MKGDRFIPNRSLMDLDRAHTLLTNPSKELGKSKYNGEYRRRLEAALKLDEEGRPFRMLVFRGSPKGSRKSIREIDEMRRSDEESFSCTDVNKQSRAFPKNASRILDAPNLRDDYYLNIIDWGRTNVLAVALGSVTYLWNATNHGIQQLEEEEDNQDDYPSSIAWSTDAKTLGVGCASSKIQLWDAETSKIVRCLKGHEGRVGSIAWNGHVLTSGSYDRSIIHHDVRVSNSLISLLKAHTREVCGLKWSGTGNFLVSGGNDNLVYIWDTFKMSSRDYLHRFNDHSAAVKALAWCPYNYDVLASGGGTFDGCIKMWSIRKGACISSTETRAQICGLQWNKHHKELLSGHGFGERGDGTGKLCLWRYPSMSKICDSWNHASRALHLSQSPDGLTVVSAGADETLRFWEIFGPPQADKSRTSDFDNLLSLKTSPIR